MRENVMLESVDMVDVASGATMQCKQCGGEIPPPRTQRYTTAITCSQECSAAHWRQRGGAYFKELFDRRRAMGLCRYCGEPNRRGRKMCPKHLARAAKHARYQLWKKQQAGIPIDPRFCTRCKRVGHLLYQCFALESAPFDDFHFAFNIPDDPITVAVQSLRIVPINPYDDEMWRLAVFSVEESNHGDVCDLRFDECDDEALQEMQDGPG